MAARRKCPKCGKETRTQGLFCPNCGNELTPVNADTTNTALIPQPVLPTVRNTTDTAKPASVDTTKEEVSMKEFNLKKALCLLAALVILLLAAGWVIDRLAPKANTGIVTAPAAAQATYIAPVATAAPVSNFDTSGLVTEQEYIPHPRFYEETGIEGTKTWKNVVVNDDEYLVVGGVVVNGVKDGAYHGYGPGTYAKITVTNGFLSIVDDDWGANEFDFRVAQAITYGWAHAHIDRGPIPE